MSDDRHVPMAMHGLRAHAAARGVRRLRLFGRAGWVALILIVGLLLGAAVVAGLRVAHAHALDDAVKIQSQRFVTVVTPKRSSSASMLTLPGTLQGVIEAPIYARTSGYVQRWYKDIGDHVKQGDLLAQLAVPEVAQQLLEARAAQDQAAANAQLANSSLVRWEALRLRNAVSQQELEERRNTAALASATQVAAAAGVRRLQELVGYGRITAPFSGVITKRNIDIGTLIDAGSGAKLLFSVAQLDRLRAYVYVPQAYASQIQIGAATEITLKEMPSKVFSGKIGRTSGAIDPVTRTLQVEITLPNPDGKLMSGAYVQVAIKGSNDAASVLTIPGNTLLFRPEGPNVAIVQGDGKVRLKAVTISRELGGTVELADGVRLQDTLIVNPADSLASGDVVQVVPTPADPVQRKVEVRSVSQYPASNPISADGLNKSQNLSH